jgi:hypothetical protein
MKKLLTLLAASLLLLAMPFRAAANRPAAPLKLSAIWTVTNLLDPGAPDCTISDCSLRAAINAANTDGVDSSISFGSLEGSLTLASPLPAITEAHITAILSPSMRVTISGGGLHQLLRVDPGASLGLRHLTLVDGKSSTPGAAIYNAGGLSIQYCEFSGNQTTADGGAIYNATPGVVDIDGSIFTTNTASRGGAIANASSVEDSGAASMTIGRSFFMANEASAQGGAIYNSGGAYTALSVFETVFQFNTSAGNGGAVYQGTGSATVENDTFTDNHAVNGAAFTNGAGGSLTVRNSTITGESASAGGSVHNDGGSLSLRNTIVADPAAGVTCAPGAAITNLGNNLDSLASCGWGTAKGSLSNTDPRLTDLGNHFSGTWVFGLSWSSPALEGVTYAPLDCPEKDQRGYTRPMDGNRDGTALCDIGAFESEPLFPIFIPLMQR